MPISATFRRDGNYVPITTDGLTVTDTQSLTTTGTVAVPIFGITGTVEIRGLWGVVTTALGNNTAAYWRLNDQTAQANITLNTGTTLTSAAAGTTIVKNGLAAAALVSLTSAAGRVSEPTTLETTYFSPFLAVKKTAATTNIEFVYTTSDNPTTGTIQFFCRWLPVSSDGNVTAL